MTKLKFGDKVFCRGLFGNGIYHKCSYHEQEEPMCYVLFENYGLKVVELSNITKVSEWIPCSEWMPEFGQSVTVYDGDRMWTDTTYDFGDGLCFYYDDDGRATHWMPLPAPPVEL